ncbi:MAG: hypothetical protein AAGA29_14525 [Planctomycetota bacterium]
MIKFRCKHCSHKIGVKDEHAGRRARCPKCKEPVRIPKPKPPADDDFELEVVSPGDGGSNDSGFELEVVAPGGGGGGDLAALAAMEANAQAQMVSGSNAGTPCPSCGKRAKPGAALCVSCGYNFKTGSSLKTSVQSAPPAYSAYGGSRSTSDEPNWLDRQLGNTNTFIILLFGCCCSLSLIVGIVGLIICKDPQARQNALTLVIIQVVINVLYIIQAVVAGGMAVAP